MSPRTYLIIAFVLMLAVACGPGTGETSESQPSAAQDSAPTVTPTPDTDVVALEGNGNHTSSIVLDDGQWSVDMTVQDNEDCSSGSCIESKFTVEIESESGKALVVPANETTAGWSGSATVGVGSGLVDLTPGTQKVTVTAIGPWTIRFSPK